MNNKYIGISLALVSTISLIGCSESKESLTPPTSIEVEASSIEDENKKEIERIQNELSSEYLVLVNKTEMLDKTYIPDDLVELDIRFSGGESSRRLVREAANALSDMFKAAEEDGIILIGKSGYRDFNTQQANYNTKVSTLGETQANKFVARGGQSEHQLGTAIDIISSDFRELHTDFQYTKAYKWLKENCYKFGFTQSYLTGKRPITGFNFEPWHFRYVGVEHATYMMNNNMVMEEYRDYLKSLILELENESSITEENNI